MSQGKINSRQKGARGERQWRDELRANGYDARRGQQFAGSPESPDVVCPTLPWIHFEVKAVERLNLEEAMEQARKDAVDGRSLMVDGRKAGKVPMVAHRRNFRPWLVTMEAEAFFRLLRGDLPVQSISSGPVGLEGQ
jgi:Holliday junction resolvase